MRTGGIYGKDRYRPEEKGKIRQFIPLYLMALPGLLYLLINNYLPMAGLTIAFRNVNYAKGIWKSDWCGLANFKYLFATKDAWVITRNTIGYNLLFIVLQTVMAIAIALFLNEVKSKFWNRFFRPPCCCLTCSPTSSLATLYMHS